MEKRGNRIFTAMEQSTFFGLDAIQLLRVAFAALAAILFLQSGLSKVFSWKSEKDWLTRHFAKSPLNGTVPILLPVITLLELAAGVCASIGIVQVLFNGATGMGSLGMLLGTTSLIMLFFGQRVAKDYAGAAVLVPYFLMCAAGMYVLMVR